MTKRAKKKKTPSIRAYKIAFYELKNNGINLFRWHDDLSSQEKARITRAYKKYLADRKNAEYHKKAVVLSKFVNFPFEVRIDKTYKPFQRSLISRYWNRFVVEKYQSEQIDAGFIRRIERHRISGATNGVFIRNSAFGKQLKLYRKLYRNYPWTNAGMMLWGWNIDPNSVYLGSDYGGYFIAYVRGKRREKLYSVENRYFFEDELGRVFDVELYADEIAQDDEADSFMLAINGHASINSIYEAAAFNRYIEQIVDDNEPVKESYLTGIIVIYL